MRSFTANARPRLAVEWTAMPASTLTFLFTDIEGSTPLWERHPRRCRRRWPSTTLCCARPLRRTAAQSSNAWATPSTPCSPPRSMGRAPRWTRSGARWRALDGWSPTRLRVRMALHTGEAEARDGDYFGPALNRAARLMAAGHGGQVLLSQVTASLVRDAAAGRGQPARPGRAPPQGPDPARAHLPAHRRRPAGRLPAAALARRRAAQPARQLTSFIGREHEMAEVRRLLADTALLTLTGSGGTGKTRLVAPGGGRRAWRSIPTASGWSSWRR